MTPTSVLRLAGALGLAVTGAIHLDLYLTGYSGIPAIGVLFLLQVIAAFVLAIAVAVLRRPLADAAGAGFALATLGGYLLSLWVGLFGFQEVRTTAGIVAGVVEAVTLALLAFTALRETPGRPALVRDRLPGGATTVAAVAGLAAVLVLAVSAGAAGPAPTGGGTATASSGVQGPAVKIVIKNFMFRPMHPDVRPGERIEVTNEDSVTHTLTAGPAGQDNNLFTTGSVGPNQTKIIRAPERAGSYPFYCLVHHYMRGVLTVSK